MDPDMIDGFDVLPEEEQLKIMRAMDQGHVDDEDWKGVSYCCRSIIVLHSTYRVNRMTV